MAINIDVITDVSQVVSDTKTLADRYDDVKDTLKDVAKQGTDAGRELEKSFEQGEKSADKLTDKTDEAKKEIEDLGDSGKDAGRELEKGLEKGEDAAKELDRKADDAFDSISKNAKKSGKDIGKSTKDGFREASEGVEEFGDEAKSTAKESAASFDGSADSILDAFQEVAANAFVGFGPAGMIAGLAAAAGIGIAVAKTQEGAEEATELQQATVDLAAKFEEAGGRIEDVDVAGIIRDWGREVLEDNWMTFWVDESTTNFQKTAEIAKKAGVDVSDAIRGMKGTAEDSQGFLDGTAEEWERLGEVIQEGTSYTADGIPIMNQAARAADDQRKALGELRDGSQENMDTTAEAIEIYGIERDVLGETEEAAQAAADAIRDKADASSEAAGNAMDVVEAENSYIETLQEVNKSVKENGETLSANSEKGRENRQSLVDLASAANDYRDGMISAGDSTSSVTSHVQASREAFIAAAEAAGMGAKEAGELATSYGLIPGNVETQVAAYGTEEAKAEIESIPEAKDTEVTTTETGASEAQEKISSIDGGEVPLDVTDGGSTDQVAAKVEGIKGRDVEIKVIDKGTADKVQSQIDGIKGRDVGINLRIDNAASIAAEIDRITRPRSMSVTVNQRRGTSVTP